MQGLLELYLSSETFSKSLAASFFSDISCLLLEAMKGLPLFAKFFNTGEINNFLAIMKHRVLKIDNLLPVHY